MASDVSEALRAEVARRAGHRCEYCLVHADDCGFPHQVDHIVSRKHGGSSTLDNLAYACVLCNRRKGADIASVEQRTRSIHRLFNPREDQWGDHFIIAGGIIEPRTEVGGVTIALLRLNAAERVAERRLLQVLERFPRR